MASWHWACSAECFLQLLNPKPTPVSLLESELGFVIVTQFADTGKRPSSHLHQSLVWFLYLKKWLCLFVSSLFRSLILALGQSYWLSAVLNWTISLPYRISTTVTWWTSTFKSQKRAKWSRMTRNFKAATMRWVSLKEVFSCKFFATGTVVCLLLKYSLTDDLWIILLSFQESGGAEMPDPAHQQPDRRRWSSAGSFWPAQVSRVGSQALWDGQEVVGPRCLHPVSTFLSLPVRVQHKKIATCTVIWCGLFQPCFTLLVQGTDYRNQPRTGPLTCLASTNYWFVTGNHQK
jgi:hypothetical protein